MSSLSYSLLKAVKTFLLFRYIVFSIIRLSTVNVKHTEINFKKNVLALKIVGQKQTSIICIIQTCRAVTNVHVKKNSTYLAQKKIMLEEGE